MRLFERPQKPFCTYFSWLESCIASIPHSMVFFDLTITFAFLLFIKAVLSFDNKKYLLPSTL